jgi:polyhydroxybutyrate depolymerase
LKKSKTHWKKKCCEIGKFLRSKKRSEVKSVFLSLIIGFVFLNLTRAEEGKTSEHDFEFEGLKRHYLLHLPPGKHMPQSLPLVFIFHGGAGTAENVSSRLGFNPLADQFQFAVVYPQGIGNSWNDGRNSNKIESQRENVNDVGFISALLDSLLKNHPIDPKRVFATGPSNGGIFSMTLGIALSDRFAAIAPVIGGMALPISEKFQPKKPLSILMMNGTEDPLVPYEGGDIKVFGVNGHGKILKTTDTIQLWIAHNRCSAKPIFEELKDVDLKDGTRVERYVYRSGKNGTEVIHYKMIGGGHAWPGGSQYLSPKIIGRVCLDIQATDIIWEFFSRHQRE